MRWSLCAVISVCFSGIALADTQFWVSVGSYQDPANAEEALGRANAALREPFSIASVDIEANRWYRVMAGPYLARAVADLSVVEAKQAGFDGAWMLVTDSAEVGTDVDYGAYDEYGDYDDYETYADDYSELPGYEHGDIDLLLSPVTPAEESEKTRLRSQHELVEEAPEGYGLHKLRRGGE